MKRFSDIDKYQDIAESIHKYIISNEAKYGSVENPLSIHRPASNETAFISKIPFIINDKKIS